MRLIKKPIFFWKKPKVTVIINGNQALAQSMVSHILNHPFWLEKEVRFSEEKEIINLPTKGCLVLNFDNENVRKLKEKNSLKVLTFGFQEGADFRVSDIKVNGGTNFKINYRGSIVPVWLDGKAEEEKIYSTLAATAVGTILGLNLVEISQALKNFQTSGIMQEV